MVYCCKKNMNKKKIVIVGCGIVGCIAAILLKQKKHDVLMYEKSGQIGGVLNDYKIFDDYFMRGPQYFDASSKNFKILKRLFPNEFSTFKYDYGVFSKFNNNEIVSSKFSLPIFQEKNIDLKNLKLKKVNQKNLKDRLSLYPNKINESLIKYLKKINIDPSKFSPSASINLAIDRVSISNLDQDLLKLKKKNKLIDSLYAIERDKLKKKNLNYAYPSKGYTIFFKKLLNKMNKLGIKIMLKNNIEPIWKQNNLKLFNGNQEIKSNYIFWSGNPTNLIKSYNKTNIDSFLFKNLIINANLLNFLNIKKFIQVYDTNSNINRIHIYKYNNISKLSVESDFVNEEPKKILLEAKNILKKFKIKIVLDEKTINKRSNPRFDITSLRDTKIIQKFLKSTRKTNLLFSPWLIYGRDEKIFSVINNLKNKKLL